MFDLAEVLFDFLMAGITVWLVLKTLDTFFQRRKESAGHIFLWALYFLFQFYLECNKGNASVFITISSMIFVFLIAFVCYKKAEKNKILIVMAFHVLCAIIEMIVYVCLNSLIQNKQQSDLIGVVISKFIIILFVNLFSIYWKQIRTEDISTKYFLYLIIIPIGSVYISAHEFFAVGYEISVVSSMVTFSFLLIFNIIIFEIYAKLMKDFSREKEMTVYAQQVDLMAKNTEEQERIMEDYYEEKHNLVNELVVLKDIVENGEWESAICNLNKIMKICDVNEKVSNSGNSTIDAIINFKYAIAREKNIEFVLKLFVPDNMMINQCDLGIILGNALDNAIEAASACINSKRVIEVSMGIKKESLVIVIKNPYEHELRQDRDENFITTKNERIGHGYGIHSIKKVVASYHGETIIDVDDNIFKMIIILNIMEEYVA
ncbi:MAG: GHKL domain-containing protein [Lachnospiraceae bacterium]|nr:GHKL domain-containing protein [Lachnospiraceae bacterium]